MENREGNDSASNDIVETTSTLQEYFDMFIHIKQAEGRAPRTLQQYEENWRYFLEYLTEKGIPHEIDALTKTVLRNYILYMKNEKVAFQNNKYKKKEHQYKGLSLSTINTRLKTLRVMFTCLFDEDILSKNLMRGVKNIREPEEEIIILSRIELKKLLATLDPSKPSEFRDLVLIHVLLDGMLRITEALSFTFEDMDWEKSVIHIRGAIAKNRRFRIVPIQPATAEKLYQLYEENNKNFSTKYFFITENGAVLERYNFNKRLKKYAERVGIKKKIHPHLFRHTAATLALESGMDIHHLQRLLGHSDLRMVIRYTHLSHGSLIEQQRMYSALKQVVDPLQEEINVKETAVTDGINKTNKENVVPMTEWKVLRRNRM